MAITEERIADFQKAGNAPESQRKDAVQGICRDVVEGMRGNHFSVLKDVDFDKIVAELVPSQAREWLRTGDNRLVESALDVMASTQFPHLLGTTIQVGMWEASQQAPMTIANEVDQLNVGVGQTVVYGYHPLGDIVDDECLAEKEETPYKGVCPPNKLTLPKRCKKKFAMGITREMLAYDVNNQIQNLMRTGGEVAALHNGKLLLKMAFGMHKKNANPWPFIQDDVPYDTYFKTAGSIWVNRIENNELDGTYTPFEAIELYKEALRDPWTGEPIVTEFRDILVVSRTAQQKALRGLGPFVATFDKTDAAYGSNLRIEQQRPANGEFGRVIYDRYAHDLLYDWMVNDMGVTTGNAAAAAPKYWLCGDLRRAFAWAVEWPFETLERTGTDTREYFDQEIVYQIKYLWKAAPMVKDPTAVISCVPTVSGITWV